MAGAHVSEWAKNPAVGAVAIVAVLAAVGVAGDLLPRLVRNEPLWAAVLVSVAVGSLFVMLLGGRTSHVVGTVLLAAALIGMTVLGVTSLSERETPQVALTLSRDAETAQLSVAIVAGATSLRSTETMLVQVVGLPEALTGERLHEECVGNRDPVDEADDDLEVLLWNETGPDQTGRAAVETMLDVAEEEYEVVCVAVLLFDRDRGSAADDRVAYAYTTLA
jgi:hypothetical protein